MMSAHGCRGPISSGSRGEAVMPADVHIRNNATGETRIYRDDFSGSDEPFDVWQWTDGNYGCDCNRSLFFMRAGGESPSVTDHGGCGTTGFSVVKAVLEDGTEIEVDDEAELQEALSREAAEARRCDLLDVAGGLARKGLR